MAALKLGQKFVRFAVKPEFASGDRLIVVIVGFGAVKGPVKDLTTPRLPRSRPSPGPGGGISSAKNCVTNTVSSLSSASPSLVTAIAIGFPPTVTVFTIVRVVVSMMETVPAVWLAT
jgi:hypothetical protein